MTVSTSFVLSIQISFTLEKPLLDIKKGFTPTVKNIPRIGSSTRLDPSLVSCAKEASFPSAELEASAAFPALEAAESGRAALVCWGIDFAIAKKS